MTLEVIRRRPRHPNGRPPLLFVHGSYSAAWVWEPYFLPFFADRGYEAVAVSLRGHGESDGRRSLPFARLSDFVADVEQVAAGLGRSPVLVGHSMGGMVVQKALHRGAYPASVLLAPVPPHGLLGSFLGIALTNPTLLTEIALADWLGPAALRTGAVRRALFSPDAPRETVVACLERLQPESLFVVPDLVGFDLPPSLPKLDVPVLVLGAADDGFVFPGALKATATTYRTTPEVFPSMAHAMMLDRGWEAVAGRIVEWLDGTLAA